VTKHRLSASRIKKHNGCPRAYELRYIEKRDPTKKKQGYGEIGSLVHEAIENVMGANPDLRDEQSLHSRMKQEFFALEDDYDMSIISDKQKNDGLACLEVAARYVSNQVFDLRGLEVRTEYNIDNESIDSTMLGYMDVCTDSEIWDWKTGRIREDTGIDELIQGATYMAGYHNEYGELPKAIKFVYLKEEKERKVEPSQENWDQMLNYARRLVVSIENDDYPAKPGDRCFWCAHELWCEASPVGTGGIDYEQF
jgi:RecB family exonuclease